MKWAIALQLVVLVAAALATPLDAIALARRWDPSGTYAPTNVSCPKMPGGDGFVGMIRNASDNKISQLEQEFMDKRHKNTKEKWASWLKKAGLDGNGGLPGGVDKYLSNDSLYPRAGIAISGGGFRAMLFGIGVLQGFDERNDTANKRGTGGFLQAVDYVSGLSGGSWATGSMAINDWPTTDDLIHKVYTLDQGLVFPKNSFSFYKDIIGDVHDKDKRGFPTAITDYWGRALAYMLVNDTYPDHAQATLWSDITNTTAFKDATYPFPVVIAIGRQPDQTKIYENATYFEFTPYEFGSWQPSLQGFIPVGSLGSALNNGQPSAKDKSCIAGYENFGWVVGASSTLFNGAYIKALKSKKILYKIVEPILKAVDKGHDDVAEVPNPFIGYRTDSNKFTKEQYISLADGGEANENSPLEPLVQPARGLDMVVAVDGGSEFKDGWPSGRSLIKMADRVKQKTFKYMAFPKIPDNNTIVNQGLNTRPTFFGCDLKKDLINADSAINKAPPLIVYLPNYPYSYSSNTDTYELEYSMPTQEKFVANAEDVATMGGKYKDWPQCFACASMMRSLQRSGKQTPKKCQQCFDTFCWNGKTDNHPPKSPYQPPVGPPPFASSNGTNSVMPASTGADKPTKGDSGDKGNGDSSGAALAPSTLIATVVAIALTASMI